MKFTQIVIWLQEIVICLEVFFVKNNDPQKSPTRFTFFRVKLYIKERLTTERVSKINKEIKPYSVM